MNEVLWSFSQDPLRESGEVRSVIELNVVRGCLGQLAPFKIFCGSLRAQFVEPSFGSLLQMLETYRRNCRSDTPQSFANA